MQFGPLGLNPSLSLTNAGVDDNIFYESDEAVPRSDFTIVVTPATDFWLRLGRAWLTGNIREDLVWFQDFDSERSANSALTAGIVLPLTRLTFTGGGTLIGTRERPGYEIDARAARDERSVFGTVEFRTLSRTLVGARAERRDISFEERAMFLGRSLRQELNRTITSGALTFRHEVTPFTSLIAEAGAEQERFEFSPERNSDSTRVEAGVRLDPLALISGSARVGVRAFRPDDRNVPDFTGVTAAVGMSYVFVGATRVQVNAGRDVVYSFETEHPYYVQTGGGVEVAQQLYGPLDIVGRIGRQRLTYRARLDADSEAPPGADVASNDRADHVRSYGFGSGYRFSNNLRVGVNVDHQSRESVLRQRQYEGWRYGVTASYGL